jgi:hypothetical protein
MMAPRRLKPGLNRQNWRKFVIKLSKSLPTSGTGALALSAAARYISRAFPNKASRRRAHPRTGGFEPKNQGFKGSRVQ